MAKTLILAEKPSQGKMYAQALGNFTPKDGYLENDKFIISWAYGHLIELANDNGTYRPAGKWDKSYLPLIPQWEDYKFVVKDDSGVKKQLKIIGNLIKECSQIYCATDADREGELIFRYIYNYLKCKLPYKRVWLSSLDDSAIRSAFQNPKFQQGDSFLENLSKSAYSRAIADWLIGTNGTQSATLQLGQGQLLSIGRVQTTILKIICERYHKHKNHQKTYSYKIICEHSYNGEKYTTESPIYEDKAQGEQILNSLSATHNFVEFSRKNETKKSPLLHTLDSLTIVANKLYKYDASQVLASAQRLYEAKMISYPRTEDPYITEEGFSKLKSYLLNLTEKYLGIKDFSFFANPESVNGAKITGSHDAIIPIGNDNSGSLSEQDKNIFNLILHRCLESFSEESITEKGIYHFENNQVPFVARTSKIIKLGWKAYSPKAKEQLEDDDTSLSASNLVLPYQKGDSVMIEQKDLREIESKPPALYTPATLTADLSNLAKFLQQENPQLYEELKSQIDLKSLQIGTKATRPDIIKNLIERRKFISFEKNKYTPTSLGLQFYDTIKEMEVVNVGETAKLEFALKNVAEGKISEREFYHKVSEYVRRIVSGVFSKEQKISVEPKSTQRKNLGTCPQCRKGNIIEGKNAFGCSEWKQGCKFAIWKEVAGKKLTAKNVEDLLQKKKTGLIKGFKSKAGKSFDAYLTLNNELKIGFEFPVRKK